MKRQMLLATWVAVVASLAVPVRGQQPVQTVRVNPAPADGRFTMALAGDSIITRRLSVYEEPSFLTLMDLVRRADVSFTNLEMLFHDYEPYAMNEGGGTYMRAEPALVNELVWAGFDLVSRANNHAGDYGVLGMRLTTKYVDQAGLVQAGVGESLAEAREAKFLETPRARVALISVAATFPGHARAGRTRGDVPARPGLNPLRFTTTYTVTRERLEGMRAALKEAGLRQPESGDALTVFGNRFVAGDTPGVRTEPSKEDVDDIVAVVSSASRLADYVLVSVHAHEGRGTDRSMPADFLTAFAHAVVDAGADVVTGHGPHVLRGVEIYKEKPILYSLGDFIFQNETLLRLPSENYEPFGLGPEAQVADFNARRYDNDRSGFPADREIWEAAVATLRWEGRRLAALELQPITLGFGQAAYLRGRPMLAGGDLAKKILDDLMRRSKPFGTLIAVEHGIGRVALAGAPPQ